MFLYGNISKLSHYDDITEKAFFKRILTFKLPISFKIIWINFFFGGKAKAVEVKKNKVTG